MNDNVVTQTRWKKRYFVVEVEIFLGGATSPATSLVADGDAVPGEIVELVVVLQAHERKLARLFLVLQVVLRHCRRPLTHHSSSLPKKHDYWLRYVTESCNTVANEAHSRYGICI